MMSATEETGYHYHQSFLFGKKTWGKCFRKDVPPTFFWLVRKTLMNFPLKGCLVQVSASRKGIITIF